MTTRTTKRPARQCDHEITAWGPHPGCREFMTRPEVFRCRRPSTHRIKGESYGIQVDGEVCQEHAAEAAYDEPTLRLYRFRTV